MGKQWEKTQSRTDSSLYRQIVCWTDRHADREGDRQTDRH